MTSIPTATSDSAPIEPISIDLVICTYNNAAELDQTLTTLSGLHRDCKEETRLAIDWSVLVVDNNSTDHTAAVVDRHVSTGQLPGLRRLFESKQGLHHARRRGITETQREWIGFIDDDCALDANWLMEAARFARDMPACGAFGSRIVIEWDGEPPCYASAFEYCWARQDYGESPKQVWSLAGAGMVLRRSAVLASGWLDHARLADRTGKRLTSGGDVELTLRVGRTSDVWYHPGCQLRHRVSTRRAAFGHLWRLLFGLGRCQQQARAMLWQPSDGVWWRIGLREVWELSLWVFKRFGVALRRQCPAREALLHVSYAAGRWTVFFSHLFMRRGQRDKLFGCAARSEA